MDKDKGIVDFGAPDSEYEKRIAAAKAKVPVGGVQMPPIPRLDQAPPDRSIGVQSRSAAKKLLTPEELKRLQESGQYIPGVGSGYAANQPAYGKAPEAPEGPFVNPPRPRGEGLRPETLEQLEAVAKANAPTDEEVNEDLKKSDKEIAEIEDQYEEDDFGERVRTLLVNKPRRLAIEARCEPLNIDDLFMGELKQRVPIIPKIFEPTYRAVGGGENLFIKRLMSSERGVQQYIADKFGLLNLTIGLYAVNSRILPDHLGKDGNPDEKLFEAKYKAIEKMPFEVLIDLSVNYGWFVKRVQRLMVFDKIKGF